MKKMSFKCSECEERKLVASTLDRHHGNVAHAAKELGMSWHGLHLKVTRLGLLPSIPSFRNKAKRLGLLPVKKAA